MKILVINAGSSSLKFTLFSMPERLVLARGVVERIGLAEPRLLFEGRDGTEISVAVDVPDHSRALALVCENLVHSGHGVISRLSEVDVVGHRVAHGAESFTHPVQVDDAVKEAIRACSSLAPLHNPHNLGGIEACERMLPGTPNVAVFDTAFHQSMPPSSFLFAVPYDLYEKHGIRRYGFHGTSHKFVVQATARFLGLDEAAARLITCHLGNGCSVAAVSGGRVLDTSMGLTPLTGLVMGTRCGDIDPGVLLHLLKNGMSVEEVDDLLNKQSGLLGVAGIGSSDMRDVIAHADEGHERAMRALDMFVHRLVSYIGAYHTVLGGAQAVVFTGGIGENSALVRERVVGRLGALGCFIDAAANEKVTDRAIISTPESTLTAVVVPTDEELMIALETVGVLTGANNA